MTLDPPDTHADSIPPASPLVQIEWSRRITAEYRSAALTQNLVHWLMVMGAPDALIRDGLDIVTDELDHAVASEAIYAQAGGSDTPQMNRAELVLPRTDGPLEVDVLRATVFYLVLGETMAVRLFRELRSHARIPSVQAVLDRILSDEVRHRDFGWVLLEWLLTTTHAPELRNVLQIELPGMLEQIQQQYRGPLAHSYDAHPSAEDYAWGLMPLVVYQNVVDRVVARDYSPRFARLNIAVSTAKANSD